MISVTASPATRPVFRSTVLIVEENTTFGISRQRRAYSMCAGVASGCWSAVGEEGPEYRVVPGRRMDGHCRG